MAGACSVADGITTGIGPMYSAVSGVPISSGVSSIGPDGVAPTSSAFRISIAPVNISVAVLVGAATVILSSLAAAGITG